MYKDIKGVIFDLDGTLVDSMWVWSKIDIDFIEKRNVTINHKELMKEIAHLSFDEVAKYFKERFNMKESIEDIKNEWNLEAEKAYGNDIKLKNGVLDFLKLLKKKKIKMAIATSNSHHLLRTCLKANGIEDYFDELVTTDDAKAKSKIEATVYLYAAEKLNVNPKNMVVFEDVPSAMMGARKAGMDVIGVKDEHTHLKDEEIKQLTDYFIVDSFKEIYSLFE